MTSPQTFYEVFRQQGISRRSFNKFCALTAASLGLGPGFAPQIASAKGPLQGAYRFGAWFDPQRKTRLGSGHHRRNDRGFYISFDQTGVR